MTLDTARASASTAPATTAQPARRSTDATTAALHVRSAPPNSLIVSEIFGPTVQGEGPTAGFRCGFVRLGRCDLRCRWCDTPYTWDWRGRNGRAFDPAVELTSMTLDDIDEQITAMGVGRVVVTGGEPLLQRRALAQLVERWLGRKLAVEIETNGRHGPLEVGAGSVQYNVSPKLASSGEAFERRIRPAVLHQLGDAGATFKFVCASTAELGEVAAIVDTVGLDPSTVWISPLGTDPAQVLAAQRQLADHVVARGWNLGTRLHVLAWGDERGR